MNLIVGMSLLGLALATIGVGLDLIDPLTGVMYTTINVLAGLCGALWFDER
jgi:hypothetical protein